MPKHGIAACSQCDKVITGYFPDSKIVPARYESVRGEINQSLVKNLQRHHMETGTPRSEDMEPSGGHDIFDVILRDRSLGHITANSYGVIYLKLGKERG